jgi:hypothetical protein
MERSEILDWLRAHRDSIHADPDAALDRAERAARRQAAQDAWLHARAIVERQLALWSRRSQGIPSREDWAAREFCHELARELRHLEPHPETDEAHWVDPETLGTFEREARERLRDWVRAVAGEEEHRVWREVVRFTDARARSLEREGRLSHEERWEHAHSYAETAARLAAILAEDYEAHAQEAARGPDPDPGGPASR